MMCLHVCVFTWWKAGRGVKRHVKESTRSARLVSRWCLECVSNNKGDQHNPCSHYEQNETVGPLKSQLCLSSCQIPRGSAHYRNYWCCDCVVVRTRPYREVFFSYFVGPFLLAFADFHLYFLFRFHSHFSCWVPLLIFLHTQSLHLPSVTPGMFVPTLGAVLWFHSKIQRFSSPATFCSDIYKQQSKSVLDFRFRHEGNTAVVAWQKIGGLGVVGMRYSVAEFHL